MTRKEGMFTLDEKCQLCFIYINSPKNIYLDLSNSIFLVDSEYSVLLLGLDNAGKTVSNEWIFF